MKDITIICQENGFRESVDLQALNRTNPTFEDLAFNLAAKFNSLRSLITAGAKFAFINQNGEMQNLNTSEQINNFSANAGYTFYLQTGNAQNNNVSQTTTVSKTNISNKLGTFTDPRDGKTYKTVKIGNQVWMAENLVFKPKTSFFNKYKFWAFRDKESNVKKYGYLYDFYTACKICPQNWKLPLKSDFETLLSFAGGEGKSAWETLSKGRVYDFHISESGERNVYGNYRLSDGNFWCYSPNESSEWYLNFGFFTVNMYKAMPENGFSVRCIKNN